jgi:adenylyltransferase/sulfurtransferase
VPTVTIELPSVLSQLVAGAAHVSVEADTLAGALRALVARHPALGVQLFDESGGFRRHVLCFHNGTNTRWLEGGDAPVREGDTIRLMQAVSGG